MGKLEKKFQKQIIDKIKAELPECIITKNDANYTQGIPDLTIFNNASWATLEVKAAEEAPHRPNQDYYVKKMNSMSFSRFIFPENEDKVLEELYEHLRR